MTTTLSPSRMMPNAFPLMQKDNLLPGDVSYGQLNKLLTCYRGWYADGNESAKEEFRNRPLHAQPGARLESGGTNHHYGYEIGDPTGNWWMEDVEGGRIWEESAKP